MRIFILSIFTLVMLNSCDWINSLNDKEDPNELGGDPKLVLTEVGNVSGAFMKIGDATLPAGSMTVISNDNGIVTYKLKMSLKGFKDSAAIAPLLPAYYKDNQGNVTMDFKFKITSEGIQDYFRRERPWTLVKYDDGVGTEYPFTTDNGSKQVRKITEKTGVDEWSMGFLLIKTTKIEQDLPESDQTADKIIYRTNHKFGLVYVELLLKNGQTAKLNITPYKY